MPTPSTEVIIGQEVQEEESTEGSSKCPYCSALYGLNPRKCEHLLCEMFYAESNNELVAAPNCPLAATLFGIEVPLVVAKRFIRFVREKRPPDIGDERGPKVTTIKVSSETRDNFYEWTYFIVPHPRECITYLEAFVSKTYCDKDIPRALVPLSRLRFTNNTVVLDADAYTPSTTTPDQMRWIMLSGLPDNLPVFLFPVELDGYFMYINRSDDLQKRMASWSVPADTCAVNQLVALPSYIVN